MLAKHVLYQLSYAPKMASPVDARTKVRSDSSPRLSVQKGCDPRLAPVFIWVAVADHPTPRLRVVLYLAETFRSGRSLERR